MQRRFFAAVTMNTGRIDTESSMDQGIEEIPGSSQAMLTQYQGYKTSNAGLLGATQE